MYTNTNVYGSVSTPLPLPELTQLMW